MVVGLAPPQHSGAGRQAAALAQGLVRRGRTVEILSTAPGRRRPSRDLIGAVPVWRVPVSPAGSRLDKALFSIALAARLLSRPCRYGTVHVHGSYYLLRTLARLKRLLGFRIVYKATMCGKDDAGTIARHRGRALVEAVDRWVCIVEPIAEAAAEAGVRAEAIVRIPNAIDLGRYYPGRPEHRLALRADLGLGPDAPVWGSVGALTPRKGFHLLVEAWAGLPEPRPTLLLIGPDTRDRALSDPAYAGRIERLIADLRLDGSARLVGGRSDVEALLRGLDGFLFASQHEGLPNAVLEALACGLPVLSTRFEAAADVAQLAEGRAQFVAADPAEFAACLGEMPEPGVVPDGIKALDQDLIVERYLALYAELGAARRSGVPDAPSSMPDAPAPAVERVEACPACGAPVSGSYECRDRYLGLPGEFVAGRCDACGAGVLTVRPIEDALASYYTEDYGPYGRGSDRSGAPLLGRLLRRVLLLVPALLPDTALRLEEELRHTRPAHRVPRILDVGCADGRHLLRDTAAGWDATGVDFSSTAVERARRAGLDVRQGTIAREDLEPGSFDLIRASHVIEHVPDPVSFLRRARDLLAPGGRMHVITPNFDSLSARVFRTYWWGLDTPRHLVVFTPAALRRSAEAAGLVVDDERHEVVPSDFWASVGYWLSERRGRRSIADLSLKRNLMLRTLLYPPWWVLARAGRGERMHMVLRRPDLRTPS
jgi:glycosyltransferase involved in cell wall biosynthesis/SAM-dependent methyltransferase